MAIILNIETSTEVCSVALAAEGRLLALKEDREGMNHSVLLGVYVDEILKEQRLSVADLDAVAVSMGPGSYTGLRIGVSLAKGLCYGGNKPLIAVSTLQALAVSVARKYDEEAYYCPMIDARRMEVYTAVFDKEGIQQQEIRAEIIDENAFRTILDHQKTFFFGNGSSKTEQLIVHPHARFVRDVYTSAENMIELSEKKWENKQFEDVAYFEPFYLKEFVATTPKNILPLSL